MSSPATNRGAKIYLAGPDVFLPHAAELGQAKKRLCMTYGLLGLFPLDNLPDVRSAEPVDRRIYAANVEMMREADAGVFNLTPFRGPSADVGTVFELGLMIGMGKPVFGYSNTASSLRARIAGAARDSTTGAWTGADGMTVEDFENADNLMIDASLAASGHSIVRVDAGARIDRIEGFEACLNSPPPI